MGRNWDDAEDAILKQMVAQHGKQWNVIANHLPNRTASQVAARWEKCLDPNITKGPFTAEEDAQITGFVAMHGPRDWPRITQSLAHRSSKQCRERWFNHLDPSVTKTPWTPEEDALIYEQVKTTGAKWSQIAKLLPGRTDNAIKNRYNSSICKRIQLAGDAEVLLPDLLKRQYRHRSPHAPPIAIAQEPKRPAQFAIPASPAVAGNIQFAPLTLATPPFGNTDAGGFAPVSPALVTSPGLGGLQSPKFDGQTPSTFNGLLSPIKGGQNEPFK
jgi:hypothetical protein